MLRGDEASFSAAIDLIFEQMMGPLDAEQAARIHTLRRPNPTVVLGIWGTVFESTPDELDAAIQILTQAVAVPYLSLHGIDPGAEYSAWLRGCIPSSTVEVWPEQGHYPHLVQPSRFLERLFDFDTAG